MNKQTTNKKDIKNKNQLGLVGVRVLDFYARYELIDQIDNLSEMIVNYDIKPVFGINLGQKIVRLELTVQSIIGTLDEAYTSIRVEFLYKLDGFTSTNLKKELNDIEKRRNLFVLIAGTSYSTLRGISYEKSCDTVLKDHFMPLINPSDIVDLDPENFILL